MRNIILPGDVACPGCSLDAILVPLCPCLAELWPVKVMSADGLASEGEVFYMKWPKEAGLGPFLGSQCYHGAILSFSPSKWMSFLSILPSIVALGAWYSTLGVVFPEFFLL